MSVTELQLQEGVQQVLRDMDVLAPQSIVINDWSVLDNSLAMSPYVIIENSDTFASVQDTVSPVTTYVLRLWLLVALANTDWKTASDSFRDIRQMIVDMFNSGGRALGGIDSINVRRVVELTPIGQLYPPDIDPELVPQATPDYIAQYIGLEVELF